MNDSVLENRLTSLEGKVDNIQTNFDGFAARIERALKDGPIDINRIRLSLVTAILLCAMVAANIVFPIAFYFGVVKTEFTDMKQKIERTTNP